MEKTDRQAFADDRFLDVFEELVTVAEIQEKLLSEWGQPQLSLDSIDVLVAA